MTRSASLLFCGDNWCIEKKGKTKKHGWITSKEWTGKSATEDTRAAERKKRMEEVDWSIHQGIPVTADKGLRERYALFEVQYSPILFLLFLSLCHFLSACLFGYSIFFVCLVLLFIICLYVCLSLSVPVYLFVWMTLSSSSSSYLSLAFVPTPWLNISVSFCSNPRPQSFFPSLALILSYS